MAYMLHFLQIVPALILESNQSNTALWIVTHRIIIGDQTFFNFQELKALLQPSALQVIKP